MMHVIRKLSAVFILEASTLLVGTAVCPGCVVESVESVGTEDAPAEVTTEAASGHASMDLREVEFIGGTWTQWFDIDNPSGNGDYEMLATFAQSGQSCSNPIGIECKTLSGVDWTQTGEVYSCTPETGGWCKNDNQPDLSCLDYRVRFFCPYLTVRSQ